jgi:hypothetical protein
MAPWKQWLVAPKAASSCVALDGMAQWLCVLEGRRKGRALSAGALRHTGGVNVMNCLQLSRPITPHPELRNLIPKDELGR